MDRLSENTTLVAHLTLQNILPNDMVPLGGKDNNNVNNAAGSLTSDVDKLLGDILEGSAADA